MLAGRCRTWLRIFASHQTSESNDEPPASKTPTTFQCPPPMLTESPSLSPEYVFVAFLPTINSERPGIDRRQERHKYVFRAQARRLGQHGRGTLESCRRF